MKKRHLLSLLLLALPFLQLRADYYWKYKLTDGDWSGWIKAYASSGENVDTDTPYTVIGEANVTSGKVEGFGLKDRMENFSEFQEIRKHVKIIDLSEFEPTELTYTYYFTGSVEELRLPDHDLALAGEGLFDKCTQLTTITFQPNTRITQINSRTFDTCNQLSNSSMQELMNRFTGTEIGAAAFRDCDQLENITFPTTLQKINDNAFYSCDRLTTLTFPSGTQLNYIGNSAFENCTVLANFNIQTTTDITYIGQQAFKNDHKLSTAAVNNYLLPNYKDNTIRYQTFMYCRDALEIVTIPSNITTIEESAFEETWRLEKLIFSDRGANSCSIGMTAFRPQRSGNSVKTYLQTVELGTGTYSFGERSFEKAEGLTTITAKDGTAVSTLSPACFGDCRALTSAAVNALLTHFTGTTIEDYAFYGCNGAATQSHAAGQFLTEVNIPAGVTRLGSGAFGISETATIKKIIVHGATAPACAPESGKTSSSDFLGGQNVQSFRSVIPNYVTIEFQDAAAGWEKNTDNGYKSYQKDGSEFQRLLTKTLSETSSSYDVYPQMHAIVQLNRTFVTGWNTLALPFGSPSYKDGAGERTRDYDCARVFANALNMEQIAVYRGLKNGQTFTFLRYANIDTDPLDEFEPILVEMNATEAAKGSYTFTDVDLNYDLNTNTLYAPENLPGCKDSGGNNFYGAYNQDMSFFNGNDYTDYYFDGTFYMRSGSDFISEGDYIIQSNLFIECDGTHTYGLKGFRGFFKKASGTPAKRSAITIGVYDEETRTTSIVAVDATGQPLSAGKVFTLSGQLIGNSTGTTDRMGKGIYIVNGKKMVIK